MTMSFSPMTVPVLETERLVLRCLKADDLDGFCEIYADADYTKFVGGVKSRFQCWEKLTSIVGHWHVRGFGRFAIEEKASGEFIGHCGPSKTAFASEPEMNYSIRPSAQGKGFAIEAVKQAMAYVYEDLNWTTITSQVDKGNSRSENLVKRLGASLEGEIISHGDYTLNVWRHLRPEEFKERFA